MGQNWEEGVYTSEILTEVSELLPYTEDATFDINKWRDSSNILDSSSLKDSCVDESDEVSRCTCEFSIITNTTNNSAASQKEITCTCNIKGQYLMFVFNLIVTLNSMIFML